MIMFKEKSIVLNNYTKLAPIKQFSLSYVNEYSIDVRRLLEIPLILSSITGLTLYNLYNSDTYEQWAESMIYSDNDLFCMIMGIIDAHFNGSAIIEYDFNDIGIVEMLIKVISNRYGIICWNVMSIEDEDVIKDDGIIDPFKIQTMDFDIRRYKELLTNM